MTITHTHAIVKMTLFNAKLKMECGWHDNKVIWHYPYNNNHHRYRAIVRHDNNIQYIILLLLQYIGDISTVVYYRSWGPSVDSDNLHHPTTLCTFVKLIRSVATAKGSAESARVQSSSSCIAWGQNAPDLILEHSFQNFPGELAPDPLDLVDS